MSTVLRPLSLLLACALLALGTAACGSDDEGGGDTGTGTGTGTAAATATEEATPTDTADDEVGTPGDCRQVEQPAAKDGKVGKPTGKLDPAKTYVAAVTTNCGTFEITLDVKRAPTTANSFKHLADKGFYDDTAFHRIVPDFVIQGGDPKGDGTGGPDYSVVEAPPSDLQYTKGVVAMAKTQAEAPGTSGSQFYVVTGDDVGLPAEYALVGQVTKGQQIVDAIGALGDPATQKPTQTVVIESVKVTAS